jgi:hypothetical protein
MALTNAKFTLCEHSWSLLFFFSQICSFVLHLKFLTIVTHLYYRILTLLGTIVCNKILFKFEDNKKQTLFKKKQTLVFQIENIN